MLFRLGGEYGYFTIYKFKRYQKTFEKNQLSIQYFGGCMAYLSLI